MTRTENLDDVQKAFIDLDNRIESEGILNHQRVCKESEPFFRDLLNELFQLNLKQANRAKTNQECYDLCDEKQGIAVQVTADISASKLKGTAKVFSSKFPHLKRLIFACPRLKKASLKPQTIREIQEAISTFDVDRDLITLTDLLREIQSLEVEHQSSVARVIQSEHLRNVATKAFGAKAEEDLVDFKTFAIPLELFKQQGRQVFTNPECQLVTILGGGFSGTVTAIRLLQLVTTPINLLIVDSIDSQDRGGLAYGRTHCNWEHLLNIQAGRISMFREKPSDFLDWVNSANNRHRSTWPLYWSEFNFTASSAVPRRIYGQYLAERLRDAIETAPMGSAVRFITAEATKIDELPDRIAIQLSHNNCSWNFDTEFAVLATGHGKPLIPDQASAEARASNFFFPTPYSPSLKQAISNLTPKDKVFIIGSGLGAYDAVMTLSEHKFTGQIIMLSRKGRTHRPYPNDHIHEIVPLPQSELPENAVTADQMMAALEEQVARSKQILKEIQPEMHSDVLEERALKSLEPWIASWIANSPAKHVRDLFILNQSELTTKRTGVVRKVEGTVSKLIYESRQLAPVRGEIKTIVFKNGRFDVAYSDNDEEVESKASKNIHCSIVICCLGASVDYYKPGSSLWTHIIETGLAVPHEKTGRGIKVTNEGLIIRKDGSVSQRICAVGPMRQGDEIERNGRLGAFVFSIGTLRNQCLFAAVHLLKYVESPKYSKLTSFQKARYEQVCTELLKPHTSQVLFNRLSKAILAVRLEGIEMSEESRMGTGELVFRWLRRHQKGLEVNSDDLKKWEHLGCDDAAIVNHLVWQKAHESAAAIASDLTKLSPDYPKVLMAHALVGDFVKQRLLASSMLRSAANVFGAASGSILLYSPKDRKLHPFAMYRRTESFTKTEYGKAVNGLLVELYIEKKAAPSLSNISFCIGQDDRVIGLLVANYNNIDIEWKKAGYKNRSRRYPSILATTIVDPDSNLLGVAYLEAECGLEFVCEDVALLRELFQSKVEMFRDAQFTWDHTSGQSYRYGDFSRADLAEAKLTLQDLSCARFDKASMRKADLERSTLSGCNFEECDLRDSMLARTNIIGSRFCYSNLEGANLDGARIKYCDFKGANLDSVRLAGSHISDSTFAGANLCNVTISEQDVSTVDFTNAVLQNCVLRQLSGVKHAIWSGVDLKGAKIDKTIWDELPDLVKLLNEPCVTLD